MSGAAGGILASRYGRRYSTRSDRMYLLPMFLITAVALVTIIWVGTHRGERPHGGGSRRHGHDSDSGGGPTAETGDQLEAAGVRQQLWHGGGGGRLWGSHTSFWSTLPGQPEVWALGPPAKPSSGPSSSTNGSRSGPGPTLASTKTEANGAEGQVQVKRQQQQQQLLELVGPEASSELRALCGRCLYRTLTSYVRMHDFGRIAVVLTGDIPAMWTRDRAVVEGSIRAQAYFILQDPWANAYNPAFVTASGMPKGDRILGRGGWVWTRNFELDSVAYFFNFLWNYHQTPGLWSPAALLLEPLVHDAVMTLLRLLVVEQNHEELSPYRYSELSRDGLGPLCGFTGMVWSAFRPSDDPQKYSFNIPDNMYTVGALERLLLLNSVVWQDPYIKDTAARLSSAIHEGIAVFGIIEVQPGVRMYAYEVDGLGNHLTDFDDPNLPSLLAMPLLGYQKYDRKVYNVTRARILSKLNSFYFEGSQEGSLHGLGSPHTSKGYVWPLATAVDALTTNSAAKQAELLMMFLRMALGNGLVHESVDVNDPKRFTRAEFGWANAMAVVAVEQLLGVDCDEEAEHHRLTVIMEREAKEKIRVPNGGADGHQYYAQLEAGIIHV